jgi:hypothetical protein
MEFRACNLVLAMLALCTAEAAIAADKPDFTGEWTLNIAKSDFADKPEPVSSVLKIDHKDPSLKLIRFIVTDDGEITTETLYSTDGKEIPNKGPDGRDRKTVAKWDGSTLVIETPSKVNGLEFTIKWKWTLLEDGKTLSTVRTFAPRDPAMKEIYEKK